MPPFCESCVPFHVLGVDPRERLTGSCGRVLPREPERRIGAEVVGPALRIGCLIPRRLHLVK